MIKFTKNIFFILKFSDNCTIKEKYKNNAFIHSLSYFLLSYFKLHQFGVIFLLLRPNFYSILLRIQFYKYLFFFSHFL